MYFNGWGVEVDYKKAFQWYEKASKNGNTYAQYVCDMYWNGFGVKVNTDTAQIWWKKAAIMDIRMPNLIYHISTVI